MKTVQDDIRTAYDELMEITVDERREGYERVTWYPVYTNLEKGCLRLLIKPESDLIHVSWTPNGCKFDSEEYFGELVGAVSTRRFTRKEVIMFLTVIILNSGILTE